MLVCGVNQPDFERLFGDANNITRCAGNIHLAIETDLRIGFIGFPDNQLNLTFSIHHDWAATKHVRKHRHQHNGIKFAGCIIRPPQKASRR